MLFNRFADSGPIVHVAPGTDFTLGGCEHYELHVLRVG